MFLSFSRANICLIMAEIKGDFILRTVFDLALFLGVFMMPFWLLALLALAGLAYFKDFYEFIFIFLISDFTYAAPEARFDGGVFALTTASIIIFLAARFIKRKIIISR